MSNPKQNKIVIIGAGFGGLKATQELAKEDVEIVLIDRNNFHTFTPLLYQVATCGLDASEIAYPVRGIFRNKKNVSFLSGEVTSIDYEQQKIKIKSSGTEYEEYYNHLIIATGTTTNYFNNETIEKNSFGLKTLQEGIELRNHILKMFERAAWSKDRAEQQALTTLVVVGGGPTGLETSGALFELYTHVLANEYNRVNSIKPRVILVEATDRILAPYPEKLQKSALKQLESIGVEIILKQSVKEAGSNYVKLSDGEVIQTYTLIWTAGVKATEAGNWLKVKLQRAGRIPVKETLEVIERDNIYAIGDIAYLEDEQGQPYPQVIPVAQQQGKLAARNIINKMQGKPEQSFVYQDRGIMATIGRTRAVAWPFYKVQLTGFIAWVTWLGLHLIWLLGFRNRLTVLVNWVWNYLTYDRSVRIILDQPTDRTVKNTAEAEKQTEIEVKREVA